MKALKNKLYRGGDGDSESDSGENEDATDHTDVTEESDADSPDTNNG